MEAGSMLAAPSNAQARYEELWRKASAKVRAATCTINTRQPRCHFNSFSDSNWGTGTLVHNKEEALLLTANHIVLDGLCEAVCVFEDMIEYPVLLEYAAPDHDYAFLRIQPGKSTEDDSHWKARFPAAIRLNPSGAFPDCEIRRISNARRGSFTVTSGTLSRTACNPPQNDDGPLDINMDYISAHATAGAGSSGGLAFNINGEGVAMIACNLLPHHEYYELGLDHKTIEDFRETEASHCIIVWSILPDSPLASSVSAGDILLEMNGSKMTALRNFEDHLNAHVGRDVHCKIWRTRKSQLMSVSATVQDLYELNPKHVLGIGLTTFRSIPIVKAFGFNAAVKGVCVSDSAVIPFRRGRLLTVNEHPIHDVGDVVNHLGSYQGQLALTQKPFASRGDSYFCPGYLFARNQNGAVDFELTRHKSGPWTFRRIHQRVMSYTHMNSSMARPSGLGNCSIFSLFFGSQRTILFLLWPGF
ncbi:trypsin-like cysteine/serine peptidase domain-containing protein [Microdochium trichocladiopsis]|uniref:Trypsin-like cysteine/serine peptidase domain-containing protein n=1 Tax=Microdochium trichocladiopsis TaxID=1682393 RepID=A0A9P8XQX0_9PEZI|nr:trypsin-like cysteine/serine peptidase domain-containing protein [Microdochium trichocladiopsis]KAH7012450.1 trypsin-like cysteine/serine peptidase domain-containing protein [Microdochium trichocladiopsis]